MSHTLVGVAFDLCSLVEATTDQRGVVDSATDSFVIPLHEQQAALHIAQGKPLGYLKFMITQQRIPISAVSLRIEGKWNPLKRSGDNFWQPASTYKKQVRGGSNDSPRTTD